MARVVVVALVWCASAEVVRADEYGGASMPLYDDNADYAAAAAPFPDSAQDYRGHSPDAPAPLDYKYEEEPQGNTEKSPKNIYEPNSWKRPARKQRGLRRDRDELPDDRSDNEPLRELKSSWRRNSWHRSQLAQDKDELARHPRRRGRHGRSRDDDDPSPGDFIDRSDHRVNKNQKLDEDIDTFTSKETTEKYVPKKPRDRLLSNYMKPLKSDDLDSEEELIADRKLKSPSSMERAEKGRGGVGGGRGRGRYGERDQYEAMLELPPELPEDEDKDDDVAQRPRGRHKPKEYHDYNDYYGMRKLHNLDSMLPMLVRRTTTRSPQPGEPSSSGTTMDLLELLWTARRAPGVAATFAPAPTASALPPSDLEPEPTEPPEAITTSTAHTTKRTTSIPARTSSESTSELSIAEKSRLSILKKSQKKENDRGEPSKKPPVLLQVTSKMPTVVMVEPPTSADPWMRARLVSGDSPQKLEKVKRLMRHKLVASAKSIQDLTDNWDDMVCDYIDVSLLNFAIVHKMSLPLLFLTYGFVLVMR